MRVIASIWCLIVLAVPAHGGPWQREKGQWFVATGSNLFLSDGSELPVHYDPTLYAEYGLSRQVTVGVNYYTADRGRIHTGFAFASFPIREVSGRDRLSANLAFGARIDTYSPVETLLRGGLAWGRGLDTGWLAVEASATYGTIDTAFRPKLDLTWGYDVTERWTTIAQFQTGQGYSDDYYAKVSTAVSYGINDSNRINLGWIKALTGDHGGAIKLDVWTTF